MTFDDFYFNTQRRFITLLKAQIMGEPVDEDAIVDEIAADCAEYVRTNTRVQPETAWGYDGISNTEGSQGPDTSATTTGDDD